MKLSKLKEEIKKIMYIEDDGIIDITIASVIANSIAKTSPVWLVLIGNSSAGKSQFIKPIADANKDIIHKLDTPTPNAFLSGAHGGASFLKDSIKDKGIIMFSDLTVLFSLNSEALNEVLSIMRMLFDGEYTKKTGTKVLSWKGFVGVLSASTPSIYSYLSEVADMGERFIYYRMKPVDQEKLQEFVVNNPLTQPQMDEKLSELYSQYMLEVMQTKDKEIKISPKVKKRLYDIAQFGALLRTPVHIDYRNHVDRIPQKESPVRIYKQLETLAHALTIMHYHDTGSAELTENQITSLEWCAYSLGNEERRTILKSIIESEEHKVTVRDVSSYIGFDGEVINRYLTELTSIGLLKKHKKDETTDNANRWSIEDVSVLDIINRLDNFTETKSFEDDEDEDEFKEW